MNTHMQTGIWIFRTIIVLGTTLTVSIVSLLILAIMEHPLPDLLVALGVVSGACLAKLLISPISQEL
jgi:hypothetical protein